MSQAVIRHRFLRKGGLLALFGALTAASLYFRPREPTLLDRAVRVVSLSPATQECFRLPDNSLLSFQQSGQQWKAVRADKDTGSETTLQPLTDTLANVTPMGEWHLSPEGKWLLWTGKRPVPRSQWRSVNTFYNQFRVFASALDGSRQIERQQGGNVAWLPDSSGWTRRMRDHTHAYMQIQSLNSPQTAQTTLPDIGAATHFLTGPVIRFAPLAVIKANGRKPSVLIVPGSRIYSNNVHWFEIDSDNAGVMSSSLTAVHEYKTAFPAEMHCVGAELAPQADRVLWKTTSSRYLALSQVLCSRWPWLANTLKLGPEPIISLWVSQSDGTGMRELGHLTAPRINDWQNALSSLHWSNNGKQASFLFQHRLYTIPVP